MKSKLQRYQIHLPGCTHVPIGTSTDQNKKKRPLQESPDNVSQQCNGKVIIPKSCKQRTKGLGLQKLDNQK